MCSVASTISNDALDHGTAPAAPFEGGQNMWPYSNENTSMLSGFEVVVNFHLS